MAVQRGNSAAVLGTMGHDAVAKTGKGDHSPHVMATNQMYSLCIGGSIFASLSNFPLSLLYIVYPVALILCVMYVAVHKFTVDLFFIVHFYFHHHPHFKFMYYILSKLFCLFI